MTELFPPLIGASTHIVETNVLITMYGQLHTCTAGSLVEELESGRRVGHSTATWDPSGWCRRTVVDPALATATCKVLKKIDESPVEPNCS